MNLLIIAIEFPPFNMTGSYRYLKFIPELYKNNVNITVITPTIQDLKLIKSNVFSDNYLRDRIQGLYHHVELIMFKKVKQNRFESKLSRLFFAQELDLSLWQKNILAYLQNKNEFDWLMVSVPQFELGALAIKVAKINNLKLLVDIRDEWSLNKSVPFATFLQYRSVLRKERQILYLADKITIVTPELKKILCRVHNIKNENKVFVISNGFEDNDLNFDENLIIQKNVKGINVAYSGSFYYDPILEDLMKPFYKRKGFKKIGYRSSNEDWSYRGPTYFFRALKKMLEIRPDFKNKIVLHIIGEHPKWVSELVSVYDLNQNVIMHGYLPKTANLDILNSCQAFLLTSEKVINGRSYCISSKLFDYIKNNKIIFGFLTEGDTKDLVNHLGNTIIFEPENVEGNAEKLIKIIESEKIQKNINLEVLKQYLPSYLGNQLYSILRDKHEF
jgi:glycosyltransferase involved in cell wall biosynthesis